MPASAPGSNKEAMLASCTGVTGVILAGGLGTRLRSVVPGKPKVLAEVSGRPFICYLLDQLVGAGVRSIVLCTGYLAEQVEQTLGSYYRDASLLYSVEEEPLGTGGAIRFALSAINSEQILVMNGDSYCGVELNVFFKFHREHNARVSLALAQVADTSRYGRVECVSDGTITGFAEKSETSGPGWVNAGIYLMERMVVESIPEHGPVSLERSVFPNLVGAGLFGYFGEAQLWDIGVPDAYSLARTNFKPNEGAPIRGSL